MQNQAPELNVMPNEEDLGSGELKSKFKVFGYWTIWVSIAFFGVYPLCNYLTSKRDFRFQLYLESELGIPFMPHFIWFYLSMYLLFMLIPFCMNFKSLQPLGKNLVAGTIISGLIFLLFPAEAGFVRLIPENELYSAIFAKIFEIDLPHNMVPSLHVVYCGLILLTMSADSKAILMKSVYLSWLILICLSTVFVHQHHILDIATGLLLAVFLRRRMIGNTVKESREAKDNLNPQNGES